MFEMLPGHHTQNFVSEIYRVRESADPGAEDAHFGWATSYQTGRQGKKEKTYRVAILDGYNLPLTRIRNVPSTHLGSRQLQ